MECEMTRTSRLTGPFAVAAIVVTAGTLAAQNAAQPRPAGQAVQSQTTPQSAPVQSFENADQTRRQLNLILRQYPPSLGEVLRLDPSLLSNRDYLTLYPNLNSFLVQHPEVAHNPSYFVGDISNIFSEQRESDTTRIWRDVSQGMTVAAVIALIVGGVIWLIRTAVDYRRWLRLSRVQENVHSKLMDRLTSNEELLAYIQTPAGKRFLESAPIPMDGPQTISAPLNRILWSAQTGLVLAFGGLGLYYAFTQLAPDRAMEPFFVISALAVALGVGFIISAAVAYAFSQRLGLLDNVPANSRNRGEAPTQP
jgi:hypothetical protein